MLCDLNKRFWVFCVSDDRGEGWSYSWVCVMWRTSAKTTVEI